VHAEPVPILRRERIECFNYLTDADACVASELLWLVSGLLIDDAAIALASYLKWSACGRKPAAWNCYRF